MSDPAPIPANPANADAAPAASPAILSDDEYSKYLLHQKNEMIPVLRGLIQHVSQVTMFFNEGRDMVVTSVVSFDDNSLVLDFGPNSDLNRKALDAQRLFCVTQLDKVKIQFLLLGVSQVEADGRPAFKAALPENMLRLQRREFYRLVLPITRPLTMIAPMIQLDGSRKNMDVQVGDISGGGLGIVNLPKTVQIQPQMVFEGCRLDLPDVGVITTAIKVCSVMETRTRSGATTRRAGCEFVKLAGPMLTLIQRYIIKMERERKARESGLG